MIRSALLLCAGIIAAACFACVQAPRSGPAVVWATCPDTSVFINHIQLLQAGYTVNPAAYSPPSAHLLSGGSLSSVSSQAATDLNDAFTNAPPHFQHYLCNLDGIYISSAISSVNPLPDGFDGSWGFRSFVSGAPDLGKRYIAISAELWPSSNNSAILFSTYENNLLQYYARWAGGPTIAAADPPNPDTSWMTVLAALAHESGHVRWAELNVPGLPGTKYDSSKLHNCLVKGAVKDFFANWTYSADGELEPRGRWRAFGTVTNSTNSSIDHAAAPTLSDFSNSPNSAASNTLTYNLYQFNQPWPSLFGAQTPDEDFVETYVLRVLLARALDGLGGAYLHSLPLTIPGYTGAGITGKWADVPRDFLSGAKTELIRKATCVHGYDPP